LRLPMTSRGDGQTAARKKGNKTERKKIIKERQEERENECEAKKESAA